MLWSLSLAKTSVDIGAHGDDVGPRVGASVGARVGDVVVADVGSDARDFVGADVGTCVGADVGARVGAVVDADVGDVCQDRHEEQQAYSYVCPANKPSHAIPYAPYL